MSQKRLMLKVRDGQLVPASETSKRELGFLRDGTVLYAMQFDDKLYKRQQCIHIVLRNIVEATGDYPDIEKLKVAISDYADKIDIPVNKKNGRATFSMYENSIESFDNLFLLVDSFLSSNNLPSGREIQMHTVADEQVKKYYIMSVQDFKCAISGRFLSESHGIDLHHAIEHNHFHNKKLYPKAINSIFNLFAVDHNSHMANGGWKPRYAHKEAIKEIEELLKDDEELSDFGNNLTREAIAKKQERVFIEKYEKLKDGTIFEQKKHEIFKKLIKPSLKIDEVFSWRI